MRRIGERGGLKIIFRINNIYKICLALTFIIKFCALKYFCNLSCHMKKNGII